MFAPRGWVSRSIPREMFRLISRSVLFDKRFYRHCMPVLRKWQDPVWHYIHHGGLAGLPPSLYFDSAYYLERHDDVRVAKLNPLYHYLAYGRSEGRLPIRSAREMVNSVLPEAAPVRSFLTPQLDKPRVSLLWDSASPENNFDHFLMSAVSIAKDKGATLRILHRGGTPSPSVINNTLLGLGNELLWGLEITEVPLKEAYSDIPFYAAEITLATSWSSARAIRFAAEEANSWIFTPTATGAKGHNTVSVIANTPPAQHRLALESAPWPSTTLGNIPAKRASGEKKWSVWRLGILADPKDSPVAFSLALEAVSSWLRGATGDIQVFPLGVPLEPFAFLEEIQPHRTYNGAPLNAVLAMTQADLTVLDFTLLGEPEVLQVVPEDIAAPAENAPVSERIRLVNAHVGTVAEELATLHRAFLEEGLHQ